MSDQFVAEIRVVGFNFAPSGWAQALGQLLPISQNTALFSLLGTVYGGNGQSTFALPDIQDSAVLAPGSGPGLSLYDQGQIGGSEFITLLESEMPAHVHNFMAGIQPATLGTGAPDRILSRSVGGTIYKNAQVPNAIMNPQSLPVAGGSLPHNNMMNYLALNYIIALQGIFPARP